MRRPAWWYQGQLCAIAAQCRPDLAPAYIVGNVANLYRWAWHVEKAEIARSYGLSLSRQARGSAELAPGRLAATACELFGDLAYIDLTGDPRGNVVRIFGIPGNPTNDMGGEGWAL